MQEVSGSIPLTSTNTFKSAAEMNEQINGARPQQVPIV